MDGGAKAFGKISKYENTYQSGLPNSTKSIPVGQIEAADKSDPAPAAPTVDVVTDPGDIGTANDSITVSISPYDNPMTTQVDTISVTCNGQDGGACKQTMLAAINAANPAYQATLADDGSGSGNQWIVIPGASGIFGATVTSDNDAGATPAFGVGSGLILSSSSGPQTPALPPWGVGALALLLSAAGWRSRARTRPGRSARA
jgi:hypothetical protein